MTFDVAVIGGSFAGLSATLQLARARRLVAVFDTGQRRNRFAASSHGLLAQDGCAPGDIVADARAQLAAYATVQWFDEAVINIGGRADDFELNAGNVRPRARRVILATGVTDRLPDIPGLAERWGRSVFHCPYCHGYELQQGRVGVIATGPASLHQAQLLPEWGHVTFFLQGALALGDDDGRRLAERSVTVETTPIAAITDEARVVLADAAARYSPACSPPPARLRPRRSPRNWVASTRTASWARLSGRTR